MLSPSEAPAQVRGGVHEHVAPKNPGTPATNFRDSTPSLNFADGVWNHGEAPMGRPPGGNYTDSGGFLDLDEREPILDQHVHRYVPQGMSQPEGWQSLQVTLSPNGPIPGYSGTFWRLRGYFRDQQSNPPDAQVLDGAFEILAYPQTFNPNNPTAILLSSKATLENLAGPTAGIGQDKGVFSYPGWSTHDGLGGRGWAHRKMPLMTSSYNILSLLGRESCARRRLQGPSVSPECKEAPA